jgi:hypothetical protein
MDATRVLGVLGRLEAWSTTQPAMPCDEHERDARALGERYGIPVPEFRRLS